MKALQTNLDRFISHPNTQFIIPVYQRNYDWNKNHCKQLFDDILEVGRDDQMISHFLGSIVFIHDDVYSSSRLKELTVIDGQQRITTITLIYIVLYKLAQKLQDKALETEIQETYLINKFSETEKLKLRPTENNDKALKFLLNNEGKTFVEYSRLIENFEYLQTRINEENMDVARKGLDKLSFVEISLEREKDNPQRIFESLNSTGLELSQADLIRNYILMGLKRDDQKRIYENFWLPIEKACTVDESNANMVSDFIRHFLTFKNRDIPNKDKVYQAFKKKYDSTDADSFEKALTEIRKYSYYYNKLINPKNEPEKDIRMQITYINKLEITVSYPFLLEVYHDYENNIINKQTIIEVFELIQSFVWRRFIAGLPTNALNKIFMRLYEEIDHSAYLVSLQKSLAKKKSSQRFPKDNEIVDILKEKDAYSIQSRNRMYFLERLENYDNNEPVQIESLTIEHIFPRNPDPKWKYDLGEKDFTLIKEKYLHTIANLTLSGNNTPLSNKPFIEKRDLPEKGYKASRLFLNKHLSTLDKWDVEEIKKRFEIIADRFKKIWKYPSVQLDVEDNYEEVNIFEADDPTHKKLEYFIFFEQKQKKRKVSELYEYVISFLFNEQPELFFQTDLGEKLEIKKTKDKFRQAVPINESYFMEANLDSKTTFGITDELFIKYAPE
jgi:uncharacterized protein with ParB-like and HNH nuclease domain